MTKFAAQDIEEQLSYAYLHAVASRAGAECVSTGRISDSRGIDARITYWGDFPKSYIKEINFNVQLKATIKKPSRRKGFLGYSFQGIDRYNRLREDCCSVKRILVVLFLPADAAEWLKHDPEALVMKRCAWWTSLVTAPATSNKKSVTVYLPESQVFSVSAVQGIAKSIASKQELPMKGTNFTLDISPTSVRDYARALGWQFVAEATRDGLYVLNHPTDRYAQLTLPINPEVPDFPDALSIVVDRLAVFEKTHPETVIENLQDTDADRFRFRLYRTHGQLDAVPISLSSTSLEGIKKLLMAGACSAIRPRPHHPRLSGTVPEQFVSACRMGHTEAGSFVWKVSCPLDAVRQEGLDSKNDLEEPFTRKATVGITRALASLHEGLVNDTLGDLVDSSKNQKDSLSSNLCDALLYLFDDVLSNNLEVIPSWSPRRPLSSSHVTLPPSIRFLRDHTSRIEEVQRNLTPTDSEHRDVYVGTVQELEGEMNESGRREGFVVLNLLLSESGESVRARTYLGADDHATAIRAYEKEGSYVEVKGILRSGRQPRALEKPEGFRLIRSIPE
jgi:uncharacterized protein DUF4365